jgi:predicted enzyme related to lactoylglutathione lyase
MAQDVPNPVVHLELRTGNLACACAFYTRLFGWRAETGDYLALGDRIEGGVVEQDLQQQAFWLPYVQVEDVADAAERARLAGASVCVPPREGPAGWRSVVYAPASGMLALWQPKT